MADFQIDDWAVAPGAFDRRTIGSVSLAVGDPLGVPCIVANGRHDGPTFVVIGGTHGQELVGTGAVLALIRSLDLDALRGTVVGLPVVNPLAVQAGSYASPQDGVNMASSIYLPGDPAGTISERLGAAIGRVIERADIFVDVHGTAEPSVPMSMLYLEHARDAETAAQMRRLGKAFGVTVVDMSAPKAHPAILGPMGGYPAAFLAARGVPSLMVELTNARTLLDAERGAQGLRNVMRAVDMMDGEPEPFDAPPLPGSYRYHGGLYTDVAGLIWPLRRPGELLRAGETMIEMSDLFGDPVGNVRAPVDGFAWGYIGTMQGLGSHAVSEGSIVGIYAERIG